MSRTTLLLLIAAALLAAAFTAHAIGLDAWALAFFGLSAGPGVAAGRDELRRLRRNMAETERLTQQANDAAKAVAKAQAEIDAARIEHDRLKNVARDANSRADDTLARARALDEE